MEDIQYEAFLDELEKIARLADKVQAIIVPHAASQYSSHVAIEALKCMTVHNYDSILLLGLNHEGGDSGIYGGAGYTPDSRRIAMLKAAGVPVVQGDHSIGNLLPLIMNLSPLPVTPFVITDYFPGTTGVLKSVVGPNTLIIASTDLSHYHPLEQAGLIDHKTIENIKSRGGKLDACGASVVRTLLSMVAAPFELIDYDTSAHLERDERKVVGYAAMQAGGISPDLAIAKRGLEEFLRTGQMPEPDGSPRAAFIGISKNGKLQGSMGQTKPSMPANIAAIDALIVLLQTSAWSIIQS